jgi:hypothetical protein
VTLTCVYCIVRSVRRPQVRRGVHPIAAADDLIVLPAGGGVWLVVSHVPDSVYGEAALARGLGDIDWVAPRALAHETVVEQFLRARAVLPMPLFTLFTADDRALAYVARHRRRIERVLSRVERQLEWGVRLTFQGMADARPRSGMSRRTETGTGYLARKRDLRDMSRAQLARARVSGNRAYRAIRQEATDARRRTDMEQSPVPGARLLVDAAFLVPIKRTTAFRATLRREARALGASGIAVAVTGPWPPYNFIGSARRRS